MKYLIKRDEFIRETTESDDNEFSKIKEILERDCSEFIKELKLTNGLIYRGVKTKGDLVLDGLYIKKSRKDRRPLDITTDINDKLNDKFIEYLGVPLRREGVFTSKNSGIALNYSGYDNEHIRIFFPIGKYKYYWSTNIEDLYSYLETKEWYPYHLDIYELYDEKFNSSWYGNGHFNFLGIDLPKDVTPSRVYNYITDNFEKFGLKNKGETFYNDDIKLTEFMNYRQLYDYGLKWIPDMTYEEFLKKTNSDIERDIDRIAKNYKEGDLNLITKQEIIFLVDEYYMIDKKYESDIINWLKN